MIFNELIRLFAPCLMVAFAAADTAIGAGSGSTGADASGTAGDVSSGSDYGLGGDTDTSTGTDTGTESVSDETKTVSDETETQQAETEKPEKDTEGFNTQVSKRLSMFAKKTPSVAQALKENPDFKNFVEATARRDLAYREIFPTIAEARQMRDQFPNGLQDVQTMMDDIKDVGRLDEDFYGRDRDGNYPGHATMIENIFSDDRDAAVALFREVPKQWSRLDPDSYREVMGSIVGATLARAELPEILGELIEASNEAKQAGISKQLQKVLNWTQGFLKDKPAPSEEERRLARDREQFAREKQDRAKEEHGRFHANFVRESRKLQTDVINGHPAIKALDQSKTVTPDKRARIQEEIRSRIERHLSNSQSFMRKLKEAHGAANLKETLDLQRVQWSYPWILNKFVREVMAEETPALVQKREPAARRAQPARQPEQRQQSKQPTAPYQRGGQWFRPNGVKFSIGEVLRGEHLVNR